MAESKRVGRRTVSFPRAPRIIAGAAIVGPKEGEGPLSQYFDRVLEDDLLGEKSWELAESKMVEDTVTLALQKASMQPAAIQAMLAGDLNDQIIASSFAARTLGMPFIGLYGACSTMSESLMLGAMLVDGGYCDPVLCVASSHFSTAERQFRAPLELGNQRTPTAQWTVTGAGASILSLHGAGPKIAMATPGKVVDLGISDTTHMGAAMAPAACDTLLAHFNDTGRRPADYDLIVTGDLGHIGRAILLELLAKAGVKMEGEVLMDCGDSMFSPQQPDKL